MRTIQNHSCIGGDGDGKIFGKNQERTVWLCIFNAYTSMEGVGQRDMLGVLYEYVDQLELMNQGLYGIFPTEFAIARRAAGWRGGKIFPVFDWESYAASTAYECTVKAKRSIDGFLNDFFDSEHRVSSRS